MSREGLLAIRVWQVERRPKDREEALIGLKLARPEKLRKRIVCWSMTVMSKEICESALGSEKVVWVNDNATYHLAELDVAKLTIPILEKKVTIFKKRKQSVYQFTH